MNWDRMNGNWVRIKARAQQRWGRLTDDDLQAVANQRDRLLDRIQLRYGVARDEAERQILNWERRVTDAWYRTPVPAEQVVRDLGATDGT